MFLWSVIWSHSCRTVRHLTFHRNHGEHRGRCWSVLLWPRWTYGTLLVCPVLDLGTFVFTSSVLPKLGLSACCALKCCPEDAFATVRTCCELIALNVLWMSLCLHALTYCDTGGTGMDLVALQSYESAFWDVVCAALKLCTRPATSSLCVDAVFFLLVTAALCTPHSGVRVTTIPVWVTMVDDRLMYTQMFLVPYYTESTLPAAVMYTG